MEEMVELEYEPWVQALITFYFPFHYNMTHWQKLQILGIK